MPTLTDYQDRPDSSWLCAGLDVDLVAEQLVQGLYVVTGAWPMRTA